jgi:uncharacterized protein YciI
LSADFLISGDVMKRMWQLPVQIQFEPAEPVPDRLFVCMAGIKREAGIALKRAYHSTEKLPEELSSVYNRHLLYNFDLGERGLFWEAGPSADFSQVLHIYSTGSLEEARDFMRRDPFYYTGIFHDDRYFEWAIHTPFWRTNLTHRGLIEQIMKENGLLPVYPPGVVPSVNRIKVEIVTPPRLFVSLAKTKVEYVQPKPGAPMPSFLLYHVLNRLAPGGTAQMGYDWEGGPSLDYFYDLSILSVNSMDTARLLRENDPFTRQGIFYDCKYFEWIITMPYRKASPAYKETLRRSLKEAGAVPPD